jgi:hypothetical protein
VNRLTVIFLCVMLCLTEITVPTDAKVSAAETVVNRVIAMTIGSKILKVDDVDGEIDADPQIKCSRTFSPIAPIINALGGTTQWNARTRRVTIVLGTKTIVLTIGNRYAVVNGKRVSIDSNPDLVPYVRAPGRMMVPVRFIAQQFGAVVTWNSTLQRVTLTLKVTSPPLPLVINGVAFFMTRDTKSTFLTLLANESVDVIEMAAGTYHLGYTVININRTRPVVVRPAAGATVILSGAGHGRNPQFGFGFNGVAGNIAMQGLIFDGFVLGQNGIIQAFNCHDITLNDMVVCNSRANGTTSQPFLAWAIYLTATSTLFPTNFTANRWTIEASGRQMSALQVFGGNHITATGWSVSNAYYAIYASSSRGPLTDFVLDGWTISDTGGPAWGLANVSVAIEYASGKLSNMHAIDSGALLNQGTPKLTDGGGNSL